MNLLALVLAQLVVLVHSQNPATCVTDVSGLQSRVDCGYYGISEQSCYDRGCCWGPLESNQRGPWCFLTPLPSNCPSKISDRRDCGFYGITQDQCSAAGCCWGPSLLGPWCFSTSPESTSTTTLSSDVPTTTSTIDSPTTTFIATTTTSTPDVMVCPTHLPGFERTDCGFYGITESQCSDRGCCYSPTDLGPYCFSMIPYSPSTTSVPNACATLSATDKIDCGFWGITKEECLSKGCCFNPSVNSPWCFKGPDSTSSTTSPTITAPICPTNIAGPDRTDCGFYGITRDECAARGCCWGPTDNGAWCYKGDSVTTTTTTTSATDSLPTTDSLTTTITTDVLTTTTPDSVTTTSDALTTTTTDALTTTTSDPVTTTTDALTTTTSDPVTTSDSVTTTTDVLTTTTDVLTTTTDSVATTTSDPVTTTDVLTTTTESLTTTAT